MCVPLVRTLQKHLPKARLTWVISRPAFDLVEGMDGVEFVVIDKPSHIRDYWRFAKRMRGQTFDVLLAVQASFRANLLYPLICANRKIGYDSIRAKDGQGWFVSERIEAGHDHTLEGFLKFASALSIKNHSIEWQLPVTNKARLWAKQHLPSELSGPLVLINPAASKPERSWLTQGYIDVIHHLKKKWHASVVLTGGPGAYDKQLGDEIEAEVAVVNLIGKTEPKTLLAIIEQADLMICPDTGPSHMAGALGTPVIALHAVTSSEVSGPYPYRHLAVDVYPQAIASILKINPNDNVWGTHAHGRDTMKLIGPLEVMKKIDTVLEPLKSEFSVI